MKATLIGPEILRQHRAARSAAHAGSADAVAAWPQRPAPSVLSERIPLFFIGRDVDGFWIARHADLPVGGLFLRRRAATDFAKRASSPIPCATMMLAEPHALDIENRGNPLAPLLRPAMRFARRLMDTSGAQIAALFANLRALGARLSRAYIEDRMLRAALEAELYRGRYRHSNKNDDDLPMVR